MVSISNRMKHVNARIWDCSSQPVFPEREELSETRNIKTGVCFSGGGTRSASCTHGQLRALDALGLLDSLGYISCVSGGAWAAWPYTYLSEHWPDEHFLGRTLQPEALSFEVLEEIGDRSFLKTVTEAVLVDDFLAHVRRFAGDEAFSRAIGEVFLDRFGLNALDKAFAYNQPHLDDVLDRNEKLRADDFYTVRDGRPYLIASGALLRHGKGDYVFEMTPKYTGVTKLHRGAGTGGRDIGGGYVESFAFDSDAPDEVNDNGTVNVELGSKRYRFTLSDVLGTTGAAPAEVLNNILLRSVGFPEFRHWPLSNLGATSAKEYGIGDGGNIENLGILPLLKRGVSNIVVFVNTKKELKRKNPDEIQMNEAVTSLFTNTVNRVFKSSGLQTLKNKLMRQADSGAAVIHTDNYVTEKNKHHGIDAGHEVKILWVYNNLYHAWAERLPDPVREKIGKFGKLANFPHFATFLENPPKIIDLSPVQANLLSQMSSAVVLDNKEAFRDVLG